MAEIGRILIWVALIVVISVAATPSAAASADAADTSNDATLLVATFESSGALAAAVTRLAKVDEPAVVVVGPAGRRALVVFAGSVEARDVVARATEGATLNVMEPDSKYHGDRAGDLGDAFGWHVRVVPWDSHAGPSSCDLLQGLVAGDLGVIGRDELRCVTGDETHARLSLRLGPGRSPMGIRLNATSGALGRLLASPRVVWVEPATVAEAHNHYASSLLETGEEDMAVTGYWRGFNLLTGRGQLVSVADTGLDVDSCFFYDPRVALVRDGIVNARHRKVAGYRPLVGSADSASNHGTLVAGAVAGAAVDDVGKVIHGSSGVSRYNGIARDARILFTDVGDDFTGAIDTTLFSLADVHAWAYQSGSRIHCASWGSPTAPSGYTIEATEMDTDAWNHKDLLFVVSAGNNGPSAGTLSTMAVAKNALVVGASLSSPRSFLVEETGVFVRAPAPLQSSLAFTTASFGSLISTVSIEAEVAWVEPVEGCSAITNSANVAGRIALVRRGTCFFVDKAQNAQDAGAIAMIVVNNVEIPSLTGMSHPDTYAGGVTIPSVMITQASGDLIESWMGSEDANNGGAGRRGRQGREDEPKGERAAPRRVPSVADVVVGMGVFQQAGTASPAVSADNLWEASSRGPTQDLRMKPDLVAPGAMITSAAGGQTCGTVQTEGTSVAAAHVAGAAAIVRQYFRDGYYPSGVARLADSLTPSSALLRAVLIASAVLLTGHDSAGIALSGHPDYTQGFGRPQLDRVLRLAQFPADFALWVNDETSFDAAGEAASFCFRATSPLSTIAAPQFRAVMAYTDFPSLPGLGAALVNDLDLTLETSEPSWDRYYGGGGDSTGAPDRINNLEVIDVVLAVGTVVRLTAAAHSVSFGPQYLALVVRGNVEPVSCDQGCFCSGHGECENGGCLCDAGWGGTECADAVEPELIPIGVTVVAASPGWTVVKHAHSGCSRFRLNVTGVGGDGSLPGNISLHWGSAVGADAGGWEGMVWCAPADNGTCHLYHIAPYEEDFYAATFIPPAVAANATELAFGLSAEDGCWEVCDSGETCFMGQCGYVGAANETSCVCWSEWTGPACDVDPDSDKTIDEMFDEAGFYQEGPLTSEWVAPSSSVARDGGTGLHAGVAMAVAAAVAVAVVVAAFAVAWPRRRHETDQVGR